ncbi:MAG: hypothetical protein VXW74_02150 [Candidatus Thermoplasmatota archaeon]|nr:hypothetical protein [Candidatus Thermoplasmatota archaeon]
MAAVEMTDEEDATGSNPTTAVEETVEVEIGIARSATTQTSPSEPNATGAENRAATLPPDRVTTAGASAVTVETIVVVTDSARKGEDATIVEAAATGIAPNATTRTSPSAPSATVVVNLGAMLEARLETTAEVDLTDATTTAVAVSTVEVDATATVAATKRSLETGPATTAGPTISPAAPRATSADRTLRTVAVTDAAHAKAEASVAEIDAVAIDVGPGNHATLAAGTAVDQGKTVISGKRDEVTVTVVAATDAAHGKTVATVERAVFDPRGPSVRLEESQVATRTTAGRNPSAGRAGTTIEGESHGRGRVPRCP